MLDAITKGIGLVGSGLRKVGKAVLETAGFAVMPHALVLLMLFVAKDGGKTGTTGAAAFAVGLGAAAGGGVLAIEAVAITVLSLFVGFPAAAALVLGGISALSVVLGWYYKLTKISSGKSKRESEEAELERLRAEAEKRWAAGDKGEVGPEEVK